MNECPWGPNFETYCECFMISSDSTDVITLQAHSFGRAGELLHPATIPSLLERGIWRSRGASMGMLFYVSSYLYYILGKRYRGQEGTKPQHS